MSGGINFKFRSANFKVEIHTIFENKIGIASKRFFFNGNHKQLINGIKEISTKNYEISNGKYPVKIIIVDIKNKKSKSFTFNMEIPNNKNEIEDFQNEFRSKINDIENTIADNTDIYRVSVDNHISNEFDTKCFRFQSLCSQEDIIAAIKDRMQKLSEIVEDENSGYVFDGDDPNAKTHRISISKVNIVGDGKKYLGVQSFTMRFPNLSSSVVINRFLEDKI